MRITRKGYDKWIFVDSLKEKQMIENEDNEKRTRPVLMKIETISNDTNNKKNVFKIRIAKYVDMRIYGNLVMRFPVE